MSLHRFGITHLVAASLMFVVACQNAREVETPVSSSVALNDDAALVEGDLVAQGRGIAERNCVSCHAIGPSGESPLPDAPPLRTVLGDFDIEALATDFREHISIGNDVMPEFDFGPLGTDALMAYLLTIEQIEDED
ncbi:MAG: cytochrome c [Pseudomonadota bacterium]